MPQQQVPPDSLPLASSLASERVKVDEHRVARYTRRRDGRHLAEMDLVERVFPELPNGAPVLDAPCGAGRMSVWMARQGWRVSALDLGGPAVAHTRKSIRELGFEADVREGNLFELPWADGEFRAVLCFRVLHHFAEHSVRRRLMAELARVSGEHLLVSYLSPWSATGIKRRIKALLSGKRHRQNHTSLHQLRVDLREHGFELIRDQPQRRFFHSPPLARFLRGG